MAEIRISLAAARVNAELTQEEAALKMHVSKRTIVNWEKGKVSPSFANMQMMSAIYDIPLDNIRIFLPDKFTLSEEGNPKSNHGSSQPMKTAN